MNPSVAVIKQRFFRPQIGGSGIRMRPVFEDFHLLRMEGNYEYPRHQHTNYEVILIDRGPYRCELNEEEITLRDGQVLMIKPGDWHQDHLRDGQRHYVVHFRLAPAFPGAPVTALFRADVRGSEQICEGNYSRSKYLLGELRHEAKEGALHSPSVQDSLLEALFWRIARGLPEKVLSEAFRKLPQVVVTREKIVRIFHRHLRGNPTVLELAADAKMSPRHFTALCARLFGGGPARCLLELKLRRAQEMLRRRGQSVKEVSNALGFANPYHFSRAFKRVHGCPPSQL